MVTKKKSVAKRDTKTNTTVSACEAMQVTIRMGVCIALALFLLTGVWGIHKYLETTQERPTLSFTGNGKYFITNSVAEITVSFSSVQQDVSVARDRVAAQAENAYTALARYNIADKDIQTIAYTVRPEYRRSNPEESLSLRNEIPELIGYRVSHTTTITIRNTEEVGTILTDLTNLNPETIDGPIFTPCDDDKKHAENIAAIQAIHDAKRRAHTIARRSGFRLKKIARINLYEDNPSPYRKVESAAVAFDDGPQSISIPIHEGERQIQKTAVITYEIEE